MLTYDWPGNVRELRTAIEHGVVMATGAKITLRDLPNPIRAAAANGSGSGAKFAASVAAGKHLDLHETEHRLILRALDETGGNITKAAEKLGISRRTLHRKLNAMKQNESGESENAESQSAS